MPCFGLLTAGRHTVSRSVLRRTGVAAPLPVVRHGRKMALESSCRPAQMARRWRPLRPAPSGRALQAALTTAPARRELPLLSGTAGRLRRSPPGPTAAPEPTRARLTDRGRQTTPARRPPAARSRPLSARGRPSGRRTAVARAAAGRASLRRRRRRRATTRTTSCSPASSPSCRQCRPPPTSPSGQSVGLREVEAWRRGVGDLAEQLTW